MRGALIRVRGTVQGVGFRPTVARLAREMGLSGFVRNDDQGVLIGLAADEPACQDFLAALLSGLPSLARIERVERCSPDGDAREDLLASLGADAGFRIEESQSEGESACRTEVAPDAASCPACMAEALDPEQRRYRYPFGSCTDCGPRFSITERVPYDRDHTTMATFAMCPECKAEYDDPQDRRYHAQPIACHRCGPAARLLRSDGRAFDYTRYSMMDMVDAVGSLLLAGEIVAVKGLGGYHLCCDATNDAAVARLRERKRRAHKAFAMMVRDLEVLDRYAALHLAGAPRQSLETLLTGAQAPIVLLPPRTEPVGPAKRRPGKPPAVARPISPLVAPDQPTLGFMVPYSPLHRLMMARIDRPVVCTSGNVTDVPQCIDDGEAVRLLSGIADWFLVHDRAIAHRVDDSVVRIMAGAPRLLRRARGYAPASEPLPPGLAAAPAVFAAGAQLKSTFALCRAGRALVSPHLGDLEHATAFEAYQKCFKLLTDLFAHRPQAIAVDLHPDYPSTRFGTRLAQARGLPLIFVQHHHAHIAACLSEHDRPLSAPPVLGIVLDGLGYGEDGALWGGEFMLADYRGYRRLGTLKPVALLGGDRAAREPWRCLYAHLRAEMSWAELRTSFGDVRAIAALGQRPIALLEQMLASGTGAPRASSAGRLFDAVAAALDLFADGVEYEGQAAMALEGLVTADALGAAQEFYPFSIPLLQGSGLPYLEPLSMWRALLGDLWAQTDPALISARFHRGLSDGIMRMVLRLRGAPHDFDTVALSGGVFQNRILLELVVDGLQRAGLTPLIHRTLPPNDGCIALGQAVVAAAQSEEPSTCA